MGCRHRARRRLWSSWSLVFPRSQCRCVVLSIPQPSPYCCFALDFTHTLPPAPLRDLLEFCNIPVAECEMSSAKAACKRVEATRAGSPRWALLIRSHCGFTAIRILYRHCGALGGGRPTSCTAAAAHVGIRRCGCSSTSVSIRCCGCCSSKVVGGSSGSSYATHADRVLGSCSPAGERPLGAGSASQTWSGGATTSDGVAAGSR